MARSDHPRALSLQANCCCSTVNEQREDRSVDRHVDVGGRPVVMLTRASGTRQVVLARHVRNRRLADALDCGPSTTSRARAAYKTSASRRTA